MNEPEPTVVEPSELSKYLDILPELFASGRRETIRVSFVVPALNEEKHIGRCLLSIARQDIPLGVEVAEIIVVDNESTDRTAAVSCELGARVLRVSPGHPSRARNTGARAATGNWLAFVDADCELSSHWLATCGSHIGVASPGCGVSRIVAVGGAASPPENNSSWVQRAWYALAYAATVKTVKQVRWLPTFNLLVSRNAFEEAGGFDESLETCEDCDLGYRLSERGRLVFDPHATTAHLGESQSLSELFQREAWRTRGNLRLTRTRPTDWSNWKSLLLPPVLIGGLFTTFAFSIAAVVLGWPLVPFLAAAVAICAITVAIVWRKTRASNPLLLFQQLTVFAFYLAGRAIGLAWPFRRLERANMPAVAERAGHSLKSAGQQSRRTVRRKPLILHARVITGTGGGPDKTILNSPRFLAEMGYDCVCAFLRPPADDGFDAIRQRANKWAAPLAEIDDRGALDWRIVPALMRLCQHHHVDVWHAHDYKTNLLGLILRRKHPMRLITTAHGWVEYTPRTRLYYHLDRWSLPRYERVICVSEDIVHECRNRFGVSHDKAVLIENAIDTDEFRRTLPVKTAKDKLGWPTSRILLGAVGRLSPEKGFDTLIRAVHELVRNGIDLGLVIAGDGVERTRLSALVEELGLSERVRLVGFQSDLRPLYEAMDLFVLSSIREGLPNALLEAMSLEVPVVATRIAGIPRLISDGENGLLVPAGDPTYLVQKIRVAVENPGLRSSFAEAGRQTVLDRYSFAVRMQKVVAIYDELLDKAPSSLPQP